MTANRKGRGYQAAKKPRLQVEVSALALEAHTLNKCRSSKVFPKKDRGLLPNYMCTEAIEALAYIMDANDYDLRKPGECAKRLECQREALHQLRKLVHHVTLCKELKNINEDEWAYWSKLALDTKNQCGAWHRNDSDRARKIHGVLP